MSIFTNALGGAGAAAQNMSDVWIKEESTGNLQKLQAELDAGKQRLINELQMGRDATQHTQRMEADAAQTAGRDASARGLVDYQLSEPVTKGRAAQAGAIEKATSESNVYQTSPGQELTRGTGENVATNRNKTAAQITDERVRGRAAADPKKPREISPDDIVRVNVFKDERKDAQNDIDRMLGDFMTARAIEKNPNGPQAKLLQEKRDLVKERAERIARILDPDGATSPAPKAESKPATNKLPAGAKKIGTSGGKDVYEAPDGTRYVVK